MHLTLCIFAEQSSSQACQGRSSTFFWNTSMAFYPINPQVFTSAFKFFQHLGPVIITHGARHSQQWIYLVNFVYKVLSAMNLPCKTDTPRSFIEKASRVNNSRSWCANTSRTHNWWRCVISCSNQKQIIHLRIWALEGHIFVTEVKGGWNA